MTEIPPPRQMTMEVDSRTGQIKPTNGGFQLLNALVKTRAIVDGGTGATTAEGARDNLGLGSSDDVTFNNVTVDGTLDVTGELTGTDLTLTGDADVTGDVGGATGTFTGLLTLANRVKTASTTINDDDFHLFDFGENIFAGFLFVSTNNASRTGELYWVRAASSPALSAKLANGNFQNTTGALTGTTGADGVTTVSCDSDGRVWVENREGFALVYSLFLIGL